MMYNGLQLVINLSQKKTNLSSTLVTKKLNFNENYLKISYLLITVYKIIRTLK